MSRKAKEGLTKSIKKLLDIRISTHPNKDELVN